MNAYANFLSPTIRAVKWNSRFDSSPVQCGLEGAYSRVIQHYRSTGDIVRSSSEGNAFHTRSAKPRTPFRTYPYPSVHPYVDPVGL